MSGRLVLLSTEEAQARYLRLPGALRIASLSPIFAAADARRDARLHCVHAAWEGGSFDWLHTVHLQPMAAATEGDSAWGATSPYGYGGPLASTSDAGLLAQAWAAWQAWCRESAVLAEFARFHPHTDSHLAFGGQVKDNRETISVDLTQTDVEAGFNSLTRRKVAKARKAGAHARWSQDPADWARYANFYRDAMRDIDAAAFYFFSDDYFAALGALPVAHLLVIEGDGQWLSGGAYLCDGPLLEYHLGASSPQGKALGTACLLQAEAAAFGQARGARDLYLAGGTDTSPDNPLLFYKRGFSRRALTFRVGEAVHDDNRYQAAAARRGYSPQQPPPRLLFD